MTALRPLSDAPPPLPHNIPVEQALLGAILANNEAYHRVAAFLLPEHFYEPAHGRIYAACGRLVTGGTKAGPVTLAYVFSADDGLKDVGGAGYLGRLLGSVISVTDVEDYARTVYDLYQRRCLVEACGTIHAGAVDVGNERSAADQIADAMAALDRIADGGPDQGEAVDAVAAADEAIGHAEDVMAGRVAPGVLTELADLDRRLGGIKPQALVILAARPGMGKTAMAIRLAGRAAQAAPGKVVLYYSLEEAARSLTARLLAARTGIAYEAILNGRVDADQIAQLTRARQALPPNLRIFQQGAATLEQIRARTMALHRRHGVQMAVVDHIGLMRAPRHLERQDRRHHIEHFTAGLKALAKEIDAPVLALSQLNRAVEGRDDKRPRLSDLRESGSIEQDADVVMFLFREEYYVERSKPREAERIAEWQVRLDRCKNTVEAIVDKNRFGAIGIVNLFCEIAFNRFADLERGYGGIE